jgi:dethiobiotin synthetase
MRLLITGTGSGVGKTWVACALARALRDAGKAVIAIKPVETGCKGDPSDWEDGVRLARATGQADPAHAIVRLADSLSPVLASDRTGEDIDFDGLVLKLERLIDGTEYALIEGVGGLLTPITWEWNMTDVARSLGGAALVVGVDRQGTINHTLLTLSVLELAGIPCAGVVLTTTERKDPSTGLNAAAIARLSGVDRVLTLPAESAEHASRLIAPALTWLGGVSASA